ncbi:MAG: sugar ABC transporter ATP-binding protein [Ancrocorticia sp.]|jgi:putative multiple sugar transport system ATP-binding protein|nr:sugar ABC transporter ATP-binding protein [Ancrocorticia sp.]MCI1896232.1 sugar ABC transporter ATP-binding protein [Ancrocorticia sp.]MCI1932492.1 sugar ABC transporter ATP-binding protein [Ancrocorticia sp.]MCI2178389.1 sugar ABC transporter ATP-binding protein [Ancrocorticia sp.]MCI2193196.1 sugar ABC transporter ATP-binding protein [Ancrocorticia sp.]
MTEDQEHNDYILEMRNITKTFGPVTALDNVSLKVKYGQIHAICGENGAGKSTLMNVLSGVYPYGTYSGDIIYKGQECHFKSIRDSEAQGIGIIHQELALVPYLSISENIFLGNEITSNGRINWAEQRKRAAQVMREVGLNEDPDTLIVNLGVGQQQLVEIAKALRKNVQLLILDEPTAALNDEDSYHLLHLIDDLRKTKGMTAIIISHKLNEIAASADEVTVIRDGATISKYDISEDHPLNQDLLIRDMVGRPLSSRYPDHTPKIGEEALRIENWTVYHPVDTSRKIVDNANLDVHVGEIVGLAGLIGAGRTELAMSVFGHQYGSKAHGTIYLKGKEVRLNSVSSAIAHGLAYATEDRKTYGLNVIQTIRENTSAASLRKISHHGVIDKAVEKSAAEKYRREFNTKSTGIEVPVGNLSGGNQQKVVLAKWVFSNPDVLILDEPTRGIDVGAKYDIYEIIDRMADEGKAVIVISSELPELIGICDRIYTMSQGQITACIPAKEASQEKLMGYMTMEKGALVK